MFRALAPLRWRLASREVTEPSARWQSATSLPPTNPGSPEVSGFPVSEEVEDAARPLTQPSIPPDVLGTKTRVEKRLERHEKIKDRAKARRLRLLGRDIGQFEWPWVLELLESITPGDSRYHTDAKRVLAVPCARSLTRNSMTVATKFLLDVKSMQFIQDKGDSVHYVIMKGPREACQKGLDMLTAMYGEARELDWSDFEHISSRGGTASVTKIPSVVVRERAANTKQTVEEIQPPPFMSVTSFLQYAQDLTLANPAWQRGRRRKDGSRRNIRDAAAQHLNAVAERLVELFHIPSLRPNYSVTASLFVLHWLNKYRLVPQAKRVLEALRAAKAADDERVWSAYLQGPSTAADIKNFHHGIVMMTDAGVRPSGSVWLKFLDTVMQHDSAAIGAVLDGMRKRNLLESHQIRLALSEALFDKDYADHVAGGGDSFSYVKHYEVTWALSWTSPGILMRLLIWHARRFQWDEIMQLLKMYEQGPRDLAIIQPFHLEIVLTHANLEKNLDIAVTFTSYILQWSASLPVTPHVYEKLLNLAVVKDYVNVALVVWRYACMAEDLNLEAASSLTKRLYAATRNTEREEGANPATLASILRRSMTRTMAEAMFGVHRGLIDKDDNGASKEADAHTTPMQMLRQDLNRGFRYRPIVPFHAKLVEAYDKDVEDAMGWRTRTADSPYPLIDVPVRPRGQTEPEPGSAAYEFEDPISVLESNHGD